jgi:glycosyltransferase involved in cell wall biosynthesis
MGHGTGVEHLDRLSAAPVLPPKAANAAPILTIVVPTLNERDNIKPLIALLDAALPNVNWEVMFVDDDSTDDTARRIRALALVDPRVRCIQRIGRRGLSTACIEGVLAWSAPYVAVMDADLQHGEALLPRMLDILRKENVDLVIGSRYAAGGGLGELSGNRAWITRLGTTRWLSERYGTTRCRRFLPGGHPDGRRGRHLPGSYASSIKDNNKQ